MRWGVGAGASRLVSGTMTIHRRLEERLASFERRQAALLFGSGYLANVGVVSALARRGDVVFSDELNHASIVDGCRLSRADVFVYDHGDLEHLEWGLREAGWPRRADRHRRRLLDGRRRRAAGGAGRAGAALRRAARRRRSARHRHDRARAAAARSPRPASRTSVDVIVGTLGKALGSYGAYVACDQRDGEVPRQRGALVRLLDRPAAAGDRRRARRAVAAEAEPRRVEKLQAQRAACCARRWRRGLRASARRTHADRPARARRGRRRRCASASRRWSAASSRRAIRPPTVPAGTLAAAPRGDGHAQQERAARRRQGARAGGARRGRAPGGHARARRPPRRRRAGEAAPASRPGTLGTTHRPRACSTAEPPRVLDRAA